VCVRVSVCLCVCACVCVHVSVCVCVCAVVVVLTADRVDCRVCQERRLACKNLCEDFFGEARL